MASSSSNVKSDVFINFRGKELRNSFVSHLHAGLRLVGINAFIDSDEPPGADLDILFDRIEESRVAVAILSSKYTESHWCLDELVKIKECADRRTLRVIPIFYNLDPGTVKNLDGDFGVKLWDLWRTRKEGRNDRILVWDAALQYVAHKLGMHYSRNIRKESDFLNEIIKHVETALNPEESKIEHQTVSNPKSEEGAPNSVKPVGQSLKQLEEKLDVECNDNKTRYVGIVGMPGIGKTYLAKRLLEKLKTKISRYVFITYDRENSEELILDLQKKLVEGLLNNPINFSSWNPLRDYKKDLIEKKVVVIIDNVSKLRQIDLLLGNRTWIKEGSIIVITTRDKSLLNGMNYVLYEVPKLNDRDSLEIFKAHLCSNLEGNFIELYRKFVDYAGGNPLALKEFGEELRGKDNDHWETRLGTMTQRLGKELRICYDELNEKQKDLFLDIAYFFRSQDQNYVTTLLNSFEPESTKELKALADKFLIGVCDGQVQMHDLLVTMAEELVETSAGKYRMWRSNCAKFNSDGRDKVRGIVLDMSEIKEMPLDNKVFVGMSSLRYLKVYDPGNSEADQCKLNLPDGLEFPKDNIVTYLNWMKFPGNELPSDFEPKNLLDLRLPYSKITSLWKYAKDTPKLRWVDLSHSNKLSSLLGLSKAPNLLTLNLEGCTSLKELPREMQKMKNLVLLNLRGCTSLLSLPNITMDSLKTLILSHCSNLKTFKVISENLETLYLNSTAIDGLPETIGNLHKLILLNLKDCKNLVALPYCLGKLRSLQELKLSRCANLNSFPDNEVKMVCLRVLLLDGTSITKMPNNIIDLSLLRRLCLSSNDKIYSLPFDMCKLSHLKWLELKYCKSLTSLPSLPPNLQCLNAHSCILLRIVASPLAFLMPTELIHTNFNFTNCHELEQVSKSSIISYVQKKSQLMSDDRYNQDFVLNPFIGTCFPGCDVPAWFKHKAFGYVLKLKFPRDWNEGRLNGLALCVVVSFKDYKDQNKSLQVKCTCEFTNVSLCREIFIIGGWSEPAGDESHTIESDHVFIGYTTLFNIKKRQHFSSATGVSLRFEVVTNGVTSEVVGCKVIKCGFTLVYESDKTENTSWEASPKMENNQQGQRNSN